MAIDAAEAEDPGDSDYRGLNLPEFVALGLFVVEAFVVLGFVAAGIANQAQYGGDELSVEGSHVWGYTLSLASEWANPAAVAVFLLAPLALVVWIEKLGADELSARRSELVQRLALVLAALTVVGGILSVVGRVMQFSPPENWSTFLAVLGGGLGSVCLGIVAIVVVMRLRDPEREDELG